LNGNKKISFPNVSHATEFNQCLFVKQYSGTNKSNKQLQIMETEMNKLMNPCACVFIFPQKNKNNRERESQKFIFFKDKTFI